MALLHRKKVLFLSLYTFGLTGGIEKVCRAITRSMFEFKSSGCIDDYHCMSMYDDLADLQYTEISRFKGFSGKQLNFGISTIKQGLKSDIIILSHVNMLIFGWLIKKLKPKVRLILFAHGIEIWKTLNNWKRNFLQKEVEIWAVSHYTSGLVQKQHQISTNKISVLNNCLDPFFVVPKLFVKPIELLEKYGLSQGKKILFTLTRLSSKEKYKGYDQVLAVMKDLPENIHYILAGKADQPELKRIMALIDQYNLKQRVTLTGFLANEEISNHFLLADVFVMPSSAEGFGISFIEAAACGCKVIAGNQDGSRDALLNGELGTLIDPLNLHELRSAIDKIFEVIPSPLQQQQKTLANFSFSGYKEKLQQLLITS